MKTLIKMSVFVLFAVLAGCSHQNPIVGTWAGTLTFGNRGSENVVWQFTDDGKNMTSNVPTTGSRRGITVSSTGTYAVSGSTMTQTIDTMSEPGRTITIPKPVTSTYQYTINGDTLTITGGGLPIPIILTRQAST